jgi:hypothetical protein
VSVNYLLQMPIVQFQKGTPNDIQAVERSHEGFLGLDDVQVAMIEVVRVVLLELGVDALQTFHLLLELSGRVT